MKDTDGIVVAVIAILVLGFVLFIDVVIFGMSFVDWLTRMP